MESADSPQLRAWQACVAYKRAVYAICENLLDLVDKNDIDDATREKLDALTETALQEVTGLMEYLQSPEALRNARRARERRIASRPERRAEAGTPNPETEPEPSSENREE